MDAKQCLHLFQAMAIEKGHNKSSGPISVDNWLMTNTNVYNVVVIYIVGIKCTTDVYYMKH